jgi:carbohydrate diacid regulator
VLSQKLAENIVNEVRKLIGEDIIVVSTDGTIIASTDKKRVGSFHEGAMHASKQKEKLIISEEDLPFLKGVKAGINLPIFFNKNVIGVIGITGDPQKVTPFGEVIRKMTELLISESYYADQFERQSRAMETFIMDWVQEIEWDQSFLNRASVLGVNLSIDRTAIIAELEETGRVITRDEWSSILNWFQAHVNDTAVRWGNERVVILLDASQYPTKESIQKKLKSSFSFLNDRIGIFAYAGVGQKMSAPELRNSFRQAERALKIARRTKKVVFDEDLMLEMLLEELSAKNKNEFIRRTIGSILPENDLLATLKELFNQNYSLKKTAEALHIHINTLHYRLKKLEEFTNLNVNNIHDLLNIYIALLLLDENTKIKQY